MFITDIRYSEASLPSSVTLLQSVTSFLYTGKGTTGQARQVNVTSTFPKRRYVCAAYLFTHLQIYKTFIFFFTDHITSEPMLSRPELCGNELHRWRLPSCSLQILLAASKRDGEAATALSSWRCATTNQCNAPLGKSRLMKQKLSFQVWHTLTEYSSPRKCHRASSWNDEKICTRVQLTAASQVM